MESEAERLRSDYLTNRADKVPVRREFPPGVSGLQLGHRFVDACDRRGKLDAAVHGLSTPVAVQSHRRILARLRDCMCSQAVRVQAGGADLMLGNQL